MRQILLDVEAESLRQILLLILVLEEHLALVGHALDLQVVDSLRGSWALLLLLFLLGSCLVFSDVLLDFDDQHLVRLDEGLDEHLVIDELLPILLPMLLLEHITLDIDEGADLVGPNVRAEIVCRQ